MHRPQEDHADLGLIPDSDHTEDMRRKRCTLCGGTGWRPGRMAVIACTHTDMRKPPAGTEGSLSDQSIRENRKV